MKNKQKKLKAENFRYVSKDVLKNPMIYINDFFEYQTSIDHWMRNVSFMVNAAAYPEMACPEFVESGFYCKQLIEHVELAYIIYRQCRLKKKRRPLILFETRDDYFAYSSRGEYSFNGQIDPADTLSRFFSFQSLQKWYETCDDIMLSLIPSEPADYDRFGNKISAVHELLLRLAQAMYVIYREGGLPLQVPSYIIAQPTDAFKGKMPLTKLGELIHNIIDKRQAEAAAELETVFEKAYGGAKPANKEAEITNADSEEQENQREGGIINNEEHNRVSFL